MNLVSKLATEVEGYQKAPFSIATTPRCRGGSYAFPWILHFTLNTYLILLSVKQGGIKYHFKVFGMTLTEIEPRCPGPLANSLLIVYITHHMHSKIELIRYVSYFVFSTSYVQQKHIVCTSCVLYTVDIVYRVHIKYI